MLPGHKLPREEPCGSEGKAQLSPEVALPLGAPSPGGRRKKGREMEPSRERGQGPAGRMWGCPGRAAAVIPWICASLCLCRMSA